MDINNEYFVQAAKEDTKKLDENKKKLLSHLVENGLITGLNEPKPVVKGKLTVVAKPLLLNNKEEVHIVGQDGTPDFGEHMMFANQGTTANAETIAKLPKLHKGLKIGLRLGEADKEAHKVDSLIEAFGGKDIPKSKAEIECEELRKELARVNKKLLHSMKSYTNLLESVYKLMSGIDKTKELHISIAKQLLKDTGYTVDKAKHESIDNMNITISRAEF